MLRLQLSLELNSRICYSIFCAFEEIQVRSGYSQKNWLEMCGHPLGPHTPEI